MSWSKRKTILAIAVPLGTVIVLVLIAIIMISSRIGGTSETVADIEQHWQNIATASRPASEQNTLATTAPVDPQAARRDATGRRQDPQRKRAEGRGPSDAAQRNAIPGIREIDPTSYVIDKALIEKATKSPQTFFPGVQAELVSKGGEPQGFQLTGIEQGSMLSAIGLRNGDILVRVNGYALSSTDQALFAVAALRFAKSFRADILRGGEELRLYYRVEG